MGLERERHYENATRIFTTLIHTHSHHSGSEHRSYSHGKHEHPLIPISMHTRITCTVLFISSIWDRLSWKRSRASRTRFILNM